jgi:hypothetical protein
MTHWQIFRRTEPLEDYQMVRWTDTVTNTLILSICLSVHWLVFPSACLVYLFICPSVCLSVWPSENLTIWLSVHLLVCQSLKPSIWPSVHLTICPSVHLSICPFNLSNCLYVCQSVPLSIYPSDCLSICPSVHLSVCPSVLLSLRQREHTCTTFS